LVVRQRSLVLNLVVGPQDNRLLFRRPSQHSLVGNLREVPQSSQALNLAEDLLNNQVDDLRTSQLEDLRNNQVGSLPEHRADGLAVSPQCNRVGSLLASPRGNPRRHPPNSRLELLLDSPVQGQPTLPVSQHVDLLVLPKEPGETLPHTQLVSQVECHHYSQALFQVNNQLRHPLDIQLVSQLVSLLLDLRDSQLAVRRGNHQDNHLDSHLGSQRQIQQTQQVNPQDSQQGSLADNQQRVQLTQVRNPRQLQLRTN